MSFVVPDPDTGTSQIVQRAPSAQAQIRAISRWAAAPAVASAGVGLPAVHAPTPSATARSATCGSGNHPTVPADPRSREARPNDDPE
jgi:hypothetical protein